MPRAKGMKNSPRETIEKIMQLHYEQGITKKEIAVRLCMPYKTVRNIITRENKKKEHPVPIPMRRGRTRKTPITTERAMELRIKALEREVELYKSFLQAAGRM